MKCFEFQETVVEGIPLRPGTTRVSTHWEKFPGYYPFVRLSERVRKDIQSVGVMPTRILHASVHNHGPAGVELGPPESLSDGKALVHVTTAAGVGKGAFIDWGCYGGAKVVNARGKRVPFEGEYGALDLWVEMTPNSRIKLRRGGELEGHFRRADLTWTGRLLLSEFNRPADPKPNKQQQVAQV